MTSWPKRPIIYEVNARLWLSELSRRYGRVVALDSVPDQDWDELARLGMDAVWLMGVWERSPAGKVIAFAHEGIRTELQDTLGDLSAADFAGSPYCIRRYAVDARIGGPDGLAVARRSLSRRGMRLMLDFVPNHVAPDHPWVEEHPEYFIAGTADDFQLHPLSFVKIDDRILARGKDPYFPAWPDVVQLNVFHPGVRRAAAETLSLIAGQCDGVRCDMAMLVMNDIFATTWGARGGIRPAAEYWPDLIRSVRESHPHFLFLAEAYWDREWELQQQGFDFCYDKRLYDRLMQGDARSVRQHLEAEMSYQARLLRFIENHDEPRAAAVFAGSRAQAAAVVMATLPGAMLLHEGQLTGRRIRLPVFLSRRPDEDADRELHDFYRKLLSSVRRPIFREGEWRLCTCTGWPDNGSFENILSWQWSAGNEHVLVVVNYSDRPAQGHVWVNAFDGAVDRWRLTDPLALASYERSGAEIKRSGLFVDLPGWGRHIFHAKGQA